MQLKRIIICSGCFLITFCVVFSFFIDPVPERNDSKSMHYMGACLRGLRRIQIQDGASVETIFSGNTSGFRLNHLIAARLKADPISERLRFSTNAPLLLLDAWNTPLNFALRSAPQLLLASNLLKTTNAVFIWSSGPNRLNEFGAGDDVLLPEPEEQFTGSEP